jgi:hypothetical protein
VKKRTILLLLLLAVIAFGAMHIVGMFVGFGGRMIGAPMMEMPHHHGPFGGHHFHHGPRGGMMHPGRMMIFGWFPLLIQLTMIIIGWIIWKTANSGWKWVGLGVMGAGLVALLPKILLIPLALFAAYVLYKKKKQESFSSTLAEEWTLSTAPTMKRDFLDEWEKKIQKEE